MRDRPAGLLRRRHLVELTLVLLNQVLVQPRLLRLMTDAPRINIAGQQRVAAMGWRLLSSLLRATRQGPQ
jgi:hypothetical protein